MKKDFFLYIFLYSSLPPPFTPPCPLVLYFSLCLSLTSRHMKHNFLSLPGFGRQCHSIAKFGLCSQAPLWPSSGTLLELFNSSDLQLTHQESLRSYQTLSVVEGLNEVTSVRCLVQNMAHSKFSLSRSYFFYSQGTITNHIVKL